MAGMDSLGKYRKFLIAVVGAAIATIGHFAGLESDAYWVAVTLATALGVFAVPNVTPVSK